MKKFLDTPLGEGDMIPVEEVASSSSSEMSGSSSEARSSTHEVESSSPEAGESRRIEAEDEEQPGQDLEAEQPAARVDPSPSTSYVRSLFLGFLTRNESSLRQNLIFGEGCELVIPKVDEAITDHPKNGFAMYRAAFDFGVRAPIDHFILAVLKAYDIGLCQLNPVSIFHIVSFIAVCRMRNQKPSLNVFLHLHELKRITKCHQSWYFLQNRMEEQGCTAFDKPNKEENWRGEFFFVRMENPKYLGIINKWNTSLKVGKNCFRPDRLSDAEADMAAHFVGVRKVIFGSSEFVPQNWLPMREYFYDEVFLSAVGLSPFMNKDEAMEHLSDEMKGNVDPVKHQQAMVQRKNELKNSKQTRQASETVKSPFRKSQFSTDSRPSELITTSMSTYKPTIEQYPLQCTTRSTNQTCPHNYPTNYSPPNPTSPSTCPDYFRWIHEDLRPWKETGVTRKMVEGARKTAHFRLVILDGRVYIEKYRKSIETRDQFTLWGILQLLRWYPGSLPDLELMFDCDDRPVIPANAFRRPNSEPPPLFRYCSVPGALDIVFPDWSFWGWAEVNIKPWRTSSKEIQEGNRRINWEDREPYAYWRGNPGVAPWRGALLKCNATNETDWNVRLYRQDWEKQAKIGYKEADVKDQCTHRYKIYIEGWAWSVSEKYILGCDSMTLVVKPKYHDYFNRGMLPLVHYWPIRSHDNCKSFKFAVEWGNNHTDKAQEIGQAGSRYIHEDMKMEYVYDYMFHLLNEYAKLLRFKPVVPPNAVELCSEVMACQAEGNWRKFKEMSLETSPSNEGPCTLPPPFDPLALRSFLDKKANLTRQVEMWEDEYFGKLTI